MQRLRGGNLSPDKHRQRWQTAKGDTLADAKAERAGMVAASTRAG